MKRKCPRSLRNMTKCWAVPSTIQALKRVKKQERTLALSPCLPGEWGGCWEGLWIRSVTVKHEEQSPGHTVTGSRPWPHTLRGHHHKDSGLTRGAIGQGCGGEWVWLMMDFGLESRRRWQLRRIRGNQTSCLTSWCRAWKSKGLGTRSEGLAAILTAHKQLWIIGHHKRQVCWVWYHAFLIPAFKRL